jgi:hypothetical protein
LPERATLILIPAAMTNSKESKTTEPVGKFGARRNPKDDSARMTIFRRTLKNIDNERRNVA